MTKENKKTVVKADLLGKSYPSPTRGQPDNVVFENVNFTLEQGEFVS